jgi:hypothetical protein
VVEAGKRHLLGRSVTADLRRPFEHEHAEPGSGEVGRAYQAVVPGSSPKALSHPLGHRAACLSARVKPVKRSHDRVRDLLRVKRGGLGIFARRVKAPQQRRRRVVEPEKRSSCRRGRLPSPLPAMARIADLSAVTAARLGRRRASLRRPGQGGFSAEIMHTSILLAFTTAAGRCGEAIRRSAGRSGRDPRRDPP